MIEFVEKERLCSTRGFHFMLQESVPFFKSLFRKALQGEFPTREEMRQKTQWNSGHFTLCQDIRELLLGHAYSRILGFVTEHPEARNLAEDKFLEELNKEFKQEIEMVKNRIRERV